MVRDQDWVKWVKEKGQRKFFLMEMERLQCGYMNIVR